MTADATLVAPRPEQGPVRTAAKPGLVRAIMENLEALAIAIVMALILKYFLIEAYKIPTGSMQPGIMGDHVPGIFDRVLVNKLVYLLRDPERYEVVVFKNPLWQRQNYIKRLVGLPGERICLRNGDVFVTPPDRDAEERIARKSDGIWRSVRKDLLPELDGRADLPRRLEVAQGEATVEAARVVFRGGELAAVVRTHDPIRDGYLDGYHPKWIESYLHPAAPLAGQAALARSLSNGTHAVPDVEVAADVTPGPDAKSIAFEVRETGRTHRATLAVGGGSSAVSSVAGPGVDPIQWEPGAAGPDAPALRPGVTTRVSFRNVDDELVLELDGDVVLRRPYRTTGIDPDFDPRSRVRFETHVAIEATGGFALTDVKMWRDIFYLPDGNARSSASSAIYLVPANEYMVLGDNTQNSWDTRQWEMATYKLKDGRTIAGNLFARGQNPLTNPDSNPAVEGSTIWFRNIYGQQYHFPRTDLAGELDDPEIASVHSFPAEFLLGKALAVFWPLPPFSPTWRLKWVR